MASAKTEVVYQVSLSEDEARRLLILLSHMEDGDPLDSVYEALDLLVPEDYNYAVSPSHTLEAEFGDDWHPTGELRIRTQ